MTTKNPDKVKQGKRNKAMGADFERRTRKDLENNGYIVAKWANNIKDGKCVPAKAGKFRMMQTGFPDFIAYKKYSIGKSKNGIVIFYEIILVECKVNGYLSKIEKEKAKWYIDNSYCNNFYIAYKVKQKNRVKVEYKEVK